MGKRQRNNLKIEKIKFSLEYWLSDVNLWEDEFFKRFLKNEEEEYDEPRFKKQRLSEKNLILLPVPLEKFLTFEHLPPNTDLTLLQKAVDSSQKLVRPTDFTVCRKDNRVLQKPDDIVRFARTLYKTILCSILKL